MMTSMMLLAKVTVKSMRSVSTVTPVRYEAGFIRNMSRFTDQTNGKVDQTKSDSDFVNKEKPSEAPRIRKESEEASVETIESLHEEEIHPDWKSLERRLKSRKTKPKKKGEEDAPSRSTVRPGAWDGENL